MTALDDTLLRPSTAGDPDVVPRRVLVLLLALAPVAFVGSTVGGVQLTGLAWLAGLALTAPLALVRRTPAAALTWLLPYLVFAGTALLALSWSPALGEGLATVLQLLAPVPAFLVAAGVQDPQRVLDRLRHVGEAGIVLALLLTAAASLGALPAAAPLSPRPMAVALVVLYVAASLGADRARTAVLAAAVVGTALWTGGRTATAVLVVVVLLSPSWRLRWRGRLALAVAATVALGALSTTSQFQERFFFDGSGSLGDALGGSSQLNTAGRRELWPPLADECSRTVWTGGGPGRASGLSGELSLGQLFQPHNDYLRTYCDVGILGSIPFWTFFVVLAGRGALLARRGEPAGSAVGQVVVALLLLSMTDNPVIYTAHFMVPLMALAGLACATTTRTRSRP